MSIAHGQTWAPSARRASQAGLPGVEQTPAVRLVEGREGITTHSMGLRTGGPSRGTVDNPGAHQERKSELEDLSDQESEQNVV